MTGEELLLAAALGAPAAGTLAALLAGSPAVARRVLQGAALLSAAASAALLGTTTVARIGAFHSGPLVASAACGAALLFIATTDDGSDRSRLFLSGLALVALQAGLAAGGGGGHGGALVAGLAVAAACSVAASWDAGRVAGTLTPPAAAIGVGAVGAGFLIVKDHTGGWLLPAVGSATVPGSAVVALMVGAGALCVAGGLRPRRGTAILLAGGVAVGLRAGPLLGLSTNVAPAAPGTSEGLAGLVLALALVAVVAALLRKPPLAIALLALAVAAGPLRLLPASRLLAAAAVLALAIDRAPAWLLVVPGAAALVVGAVDAGSALSVACAGAVGLVGAVLAGVELIEIGGAGGPTTTKTRAFDAWSLPAISAGAWLLLAPGRWSWAAAQELDYYDAGAARACAAGLIAAVLVIAWWTRVDQPESEAPELVRSERSAP